MPSDSEILEAYRSYGKYLKSVTKGYARALGLSGDEHKQQVLVAIWQALACHEPDKGEPSTLARKILTRTLGNALKAAMRPKRLPPPTLSLDDLYAAHEPAATDGDPLAYVLLQELVTEIHTACTESEAAALWLGVAGYSAKEGAVTTERSVYMATQRARTKAMDILNGGDTQSSERLVAECHIYKCCKRNMRRTGCQVITDPAAWWASGKCSAYTDDKQWQGKADDAKRRYEVVKGGRDNARASSGRDDSVR